MKTELNKKSIDTIIKILDHRLEQERIRQAKAMDQMDFENYHRASAKLHAYADIHATIIHELRK